MRYAAGPRNMSIEAHRRPDDLQAQAVTVIYQLLKESVNSMIYSRVNKINGCLAS